MIITKLTKAHFTKIFLFSFICSLSLLHKEINQDFFTFYYIGEGITQGLNMYSDFADNKGPIVYITFALIYLIFGSNYTLAVILSLSLIDAVGVYFFIRFLEIFLKWNVFEKTTITKLLQLFAVVAIYKMFALGILKGGLFAENIAVALVSVSLYLFVTHKELLSGIAFSLAFLTKIVTVPYILIYLPVIIFQKSSRTTNSNQDKLSLIVKRLRFDNKWISQSLNIIRSKPFILFASGGLVTLTIFTSYLLVSGEYNYFIENVYYYNLSYSSLYKTGRFFSFYQIFSKNIIVFFGVLYSILFFLEASKKHKVKWLYSSIFISSFLTLFIGGNIFDHHLTQLSYIYVFILIYIIVSKKKKQLLKIAHLIFIGSIILGYFILPFAYKKVVLSPELVRDINNFASDYSYIQIVPQVPQLYFISDKKSPDRYFQYYFLSNLYNKNNSKDVEIHKSLDKNITTQTGFIFIHSPNKYHTYVINEYISNFSEDFELKKVSEKIYNKNYRVEYYKSNIY